MLAATVRVTRDLDLAEESVQEAYVQALRTWPGDGIPQRPGAWLTTVARRAALNALRRQRALRAKLPLLIIPEEEPHGDQHDDGWPRAAPEERPSGGTDETPADDRLRLIFVCCHPSLAAEARVALTLRLLCGLSTAEVARALLVSETTMAARLTRAKKKIAVARIPYAVPAAAELPSRLDAVLTVLHLLCSAGHTAAAGSALLRDDLADRAVDLARMLRLLLPAFPETAGLLALLLTHQARRAGRTTPDGRLLRLEDQDRSLWDRGLIGEADRLITAALVAAPPGRFTVQAAIAALHASAPSFAETDWSQILLLYDRLAELWPSPVVALNRAVAVAAVHGPAAALALVEELDRDGRLAGYQYLPATRAELLSRLGRHGEAARAYRKALDLTSNEAERQFLIERLEP